MTLQLLKKTVLMSLFSLVMAGCSPPTSTVIISSEEEQNKVVHDVLSGPDARVRVELKDVGLLFTVQKQGDSASLISADGETPEVKMSVAKMRIELAEGELARCSSNLKNIATALEMWSTDHAGRYPKKLKSVAPNYLRTIPFCPRAYEDTYSASYQRKTKPDFYKLSCKGEHHVAAGLPADFPQYTSKVGLISSP